MKRKYVPIITLSLAILLVGSVAYATDKRKKSKSVVNEPSEMTEEALKAELLDTADDQRKKKVAAKDLSSVKNADIDLAELKIK